MSCVTLQLQTCVTDRNMKQDSYTLGYQALNKDNFIFSKTKTRRNGSNLKKVKARLHSQFWLRFTGRFSSFDKCKRMNSYEYCSLQLPIILTSLTYPSVYIYQKKRIAPKITAKIASVNGD